MSRITDQVIEAEQIAQSSGSVRARALSILRNCGVFFPAAILFFSVLAFGATQDWSLFVLRVAAIALLLLWALTKLSDQKAVLTRPPLSIPIVIVFIVIGIQLSFSTTAYRYATVSELLQYVAYVAIYFVVCDSWKKEVDREHILRLFAFFGFAVALFAIIQGLTSKGELYWAITPHFGGSVYGPYVNRNHYSGLMELLAPVPLALAAVRGQSLEKRALLIFAGIVMGVSVFSSQSRAGMASFVLETVILCLFLLRIRRSIRTGAAFAFGAILFAAFILIFGAGELFQRFSELSDQARLAIFKDSLKMIRQHPLLGWGLGTFPTIYPHFRSFYTDNFVNQAHNDVIQFVVETGLIGAAAGVWFIVSLYRKALYTLDRWTGSVGDASVLAAIVGCTGLLFHSFFDFNLHIPANAVAFIMFCALATMDNPEHHKRILHSPLT